MKNKAHITESSGDKKAFDVCIMNPPYDKNLHLKIVEKVIPHCEETINISPIRWLQDPLAKYKKNSDYNKFKESIAEHIKSVEVVSRGDSDDIFNARFAADNAIVYCDNNKHDAYEKFNTNPIIEKVRAKWQDANIEYNKKDGWRVKIQTINNLTQQKGVQIKNTEPLGKLLAFYNGEKDGRKWWTFWNTNQHTKKTDEITHSIKFDSEEEAQNFIDSYKTYFVKYVENMIVTDINLKSYNLLWMSDYTKPWTNKRFCDYFKITGYISDTEAEPGSEWEEILNTMKKYK